MISYSEYKLKEVNEPAGPPPSSNPMPDPVSGMPPGSPAAGSPPGLGSPPMDISSGMPGMGDMGGMGMGGMGGASPPDQKPTLLNLDASNFWDVLEAIFKKAKQESKSQKKLN